MCKAAVVVEVAALPTTSFQSAREPSVESEAAAVAPNEPVEEISEATPMDVSDASDHEDEDDEPEEEEFVVHNIDFDDLNNPQLMSIYAAEIYDYIRTTEAQYPIREHYLEVEGQIVKGWMRAILLDWLVQVHLRFRLHQETLYLTAAIIDRYLQETLVTKDKLQLVGITAMLIACKYEEVFVPEIEDFSYITDHAYPPTEIRQMECTILRVLKFELGRPIALHFLRRNSKAAEAAAKTHTLAKYLMELSLIDYELVHILPSQIAAAALCLSMKLLSTDAAPLPWTDVVVYHSKYTEVQLKDVMLRMWHLVDVAPNAKRMAVFNKYCSHKLLHVALLPQLNVDTIVPVLEAL